MKSISSHPTRRHAQPRKGMSRAAVVVLAALTPIVGLLVVTQPATSSPSKAVHKSYVCKYVGTPGIDERLQTGKNPIWVDNHALTGKDNSVVKVGDTFSDKHVKSVVIVANTVKLNPEPSISACPVPVGPTEVTAVAPSATVPDCTKDGSLKVPKSTTAITYESTPSGKGPGTYTVTATAKPGYVIVGDAAWTVEVLPKVTGEVCLTKVEATAPTVLAPTCTQDGKLVVPVSTTSITYASLPAGTGPGTYTVTATATAGNLLVGTSSWTVTVLPMLTGEECATLVVVTPEEPTVVPSEVCGVEGTYIIPTTTGISYLLNGEPIAANTYPGPASGTVTAVAEKGYVLVDNEWSFALSLEAAKACPGAVLAVPVNPTVAKSTTCEVQGTYVIPTTTGLTYLLNGKAVAAGKHKGPASGTVTAKAAEGYTLSNAAWAYALALPAAEICQVDAPTTTTPTETTNALPKTGAPVAGLATAGALALLLGFALLAAGTRRLPETLN